MKRTFAFLSKTRFPTSSAHWLPALAVSCGLGLFWFWVLFNTFALPFSHVYWTYRYDSDSFQHQLGWTVFRSEAWSLPPGRIAALNYPYGSSIVYTDSIPLLAIPLKLVSPLLGTHFQYLGAWTLACLIAQVFLGMLILGELGAPLRRQALGASLLALAPPLIYRAFLHEALTAHWLILSAIYLLLVQRRRPLPFGAWALLCTIGLLVHPYFVVMLLPFELTSLGLAFWPNRKPGPSLAPGRRLLALAELGLTLGALAGAGWLIGLFAVGGEGLQGAFGRFTLNLNAFFNPLDTAALLAPRPMALDTQYEGYAYLGAGLIGLGVVETILVLRAGVDWGRVRRYALVWIPALLLASTALGNRLSLDGTTLLQLELPEFAQYWMTVFQAVGRFVWPLFYVVVLFILAKAPRLFKSADLLLLICIAVQLVDLHPLISTKRFTEFASYNSPLIGDFWEQAPRTFRHLMLLPAQGTAGELGPYSIYAAEHGLTLNASYLARSDNQQLAADAQQAYKQLLGGIPQEDTIYILLDPAQARELGARKGAEQLIFCAQGRAWTVLPRANPLVTEHPELFGACGVPPK